MATRARLSRRHFVVAARRSQSMSRWGERGGQKRCGSGGQTATQMCGCGGQAEPDSVSRHQTQGRCQWTGVADIIRLRLRRGCAPAASSICARSTGAQQLLPHQGTTGGAKAQCRAEQLPRRAQLLRRLLKHGGSEHEANCRAFVAALSFLYILCCIFIHCKLHHEAFATEQHSGTAGAGMCGNTGRLHYVSCMSGHTCWGDASGRPCGSHTMFHTQPTQTTWRMGKEILVPIKEQLGQSYTLYTFVIHKVTV